MGELGFLGTLVPEKEGRAAADHVAYALALMEIAAGNGSCSTIISVHNSIGCLPLCRYGTREQKEYPALLPSVFVRVSSGVSSRVLSFARL